MTDADLLAASTAVLAAFVRPTIGAGTPVLSRRLGRGVAFSDDLVLPSETLKVRVRIDDADESTWRVDLRDCSPRTDATPWAIASADDARLAAVLAFSTFGDTPEPDARLFDAIAVELEPSSWVGGTQASDDPCFRAFAIARIYDAIAGALEKAWADRGRAGSCSLGAIVVARSEGGELVDVVPGGRGGDAKAAGTSWPGPLLPAGLLRACEAITVVHATRPESAGFGARSGGDGTIARYELAAPTCMRIAIDRQTNPPHGLDRAGNGAPARLSVIEPDGSRRELAPWHTHLLERGNVVEVATAGGGGHGFPGWGDIDWDPSSFGFA